MSCVTASSPATRTDAEGITTDMVIQRILETVPVPDRHDPASCLYCELEDLLKLRFQGISFSTI